MENIPHVPIINVSTLLKNPKSLSSSSEAATIIEEISAACENWGFFYVTNHNVDMSLINAVQREGMNFFHLPKDLKNTVARFEGNFQGYSDSELTKQKLDLKEIFDFSSQDAFQSSSTLPSSPTISNIHGKNQWPSGETLPNFKSTMIAYFDEVRKLGLVLMDAIFQGLQSKGGETTFPENPVQEFFSLEEDTSFGRLNYYPVYNLKGDSTKPDKSELGVGPHSDAGVLTVLYQEEGVCSLQVEKDGVFYDVPPIKDSFVINIGDMMQVWSNGRYSAPVHRVLTNPSQSRFSLPFFLNPKYSCVVKPLVSGEDVQKYESILWSEFRRGRVQGDYADLGEELQISHYLRKTK